MVILGLIFRQMDFGEVVKAIRTASFDLLALSVALTLVAHLLRIFKWHIVLRDQYDGLEVAVLFFSSKAFGDLSPARLGEFAPLLSEKYRSGKVAALLLVDRVFEAYATLLFGAIGFLLLQFRDARIIVGSLTVFLALSLSLALLMSTRFWGKVQRLVGHWPVLGQGLRIAVAVSRGLDSLKRWLGLLWLISMIATALGLFFFQVLFLSVGVRVSWPLAATMVCVAAVAALIAFTPWGLGIVEAPLWWLGRLYNLPPAGIGAFYVLVRVVPLSLVWLLYGMTLLASHYWKERASS